MKDQSNSKRKSFSVFRSAREEAETKRGEQEWNNEGGAIRSTSGHVVHVAGTDRPYVVILRDGDSGQSEHAFATMREAETFIQRSTPTPRRTLSALYDRPPSDT